MDQNSVELMVDKLPPIKKNPYAFQKKDYLTWLIISLTIIIVVPALMFALVSGLGRKPWTDDTSVAFNIGSLSVAWYGIMIFFGFACAIALGIIKLWKLYKVSIDPFYWFCLMAIPSAILGARIWSCIIGDARWSSFWAFRDGGLAIQGGVILTVIVACIWFPLILKRPAYQVRDLGTEPNAVRQVSMWIYADAVMPAILIGQVLGRYGNYMNQELYGSAINGSWSNFISHLFPYMTGTDDSEKMQAGVTYQPLFFIESFTNWWGLILLYIVAEFVPRKKAGDLGIGYFLWYGILRMILEPLRETDFTFKGTYVMDALWIALGIVLLVMNHAVFPRLRKYRITNLIFYSLWDAKEVQRTEHKIKHIENINIRLQRKLKTEKDVNEISEINSEINKNTAILRRLMDKRDKLKSGKVPWREKFIRKPSEMLYYLGR